MKSKQFRLLMYYGIMSLLFTIESIVYINDSGDQTWFAKKSSQFHFFEFAIFRYKTWSSRLLIESFTMFYSNHYLLFDLTMFVGVAALFYFFNKLFIKNSTSSALHCAFPVIFVVVFPSIFFASAGLIATMTNYLFPMITMVIACYLVSTKKLYQSVIAVPFLVLTCMQEQFTVFLFIVYFGLLVLEIIKKSILSKSYFLVLGISALGIISGLLSPGSALRAKAESKLWYPDFNQIPLVTKFLKGYIETNRVLFVTTELSILLLFIVLLLVVSIIKRRFIVSVLSGATLFSLLNNRFGISSLLTAVQKIIDIQNARKDATYFDFKENLYPLVLYTIILLALALCTVLVLDDINQKVYAILILAAGYTARMTVSLSPTIYASGLRTYTPLVLSLIIVSMMLVQEMYIKYQQNAVE